MLSEQLLVYKIRLRVLLHCDGSELLLALLEPLLVLLEFNDDCGCAAVMIFGDGYHMFCKMGIIIRITLCGEGNAIREVARYSRMVRPFVGQPVDKCSSSAVHRNRCRQSPAMDRVA